MANNLHDIINAHVIHMHRQTNKQTWKMKAILGPAGTWFTYAQLVKIKSVIKL